MMVQTITKLTTEVSALLKKTGWKLSTAESCTGGGLAYYLTSVPGSSAWFERGFVTYSNLAKEQMLDLDPAILASFGAVSAETAIAMAEGVLKNSAAEIGIAITGIAGPDGGTPNKPVGTVWLAFASQHFATVSEMLTLSGDRASIREQSITIALTVLLRLLST